MLKRRSVFLVVVMFLLGLWPRNVWSQSFPTPIWVADGIDFAVSPNGEVVAVEDSSGIQLYDRWGNKKGDLVDYGLVRANPDWRGEAELTFLEYDGTQSRVMSYDFHTGTLSSLVGFEGDGSILAFEFFGPSLLVQFQAAVSLQLHQIDLGQMTEIPNSTSCEPLELRAEGVLILCDRPTQRGTAKLVEWVAVGSTMSASEVLVPEEYESAGAALSPDATAVVFSGSKNGEPESLQYMCRGGTTVVQYSDTDSNPRQVQWVGDWIYFLGTSSAQPVRWGVFRVQAPTVRCR